MASDEVVINVRTRGARQAARDADLASAGIRRLGVNAKAASAGFSTLRRSSSQLSGATFHALGQGAQYAGLGIAALGVYSIKTGLQFNASMEQNTVAFTNFLGSTKAARTELGFLYQTAAKTPFQVPQITAAAKQLLSYGFSAKQANGYLVSISDAAAGAGLGADAIDRIILAVGQIKGKGKLQTQELNQLAQLGIIDRGKLAKNLHVTTAALSDAGNQSISSNRALVAIKKTLDDDFGGQAAKQAKTFNGQLSNIQDNLNITLGLITKPAFDKLRKDVFPQIMGATGDIQKIFGRKDLDASQKITMSEAVLKRRFGPLERELQGAITRARIPEHLGDAVGAAAPRIASALGRAAPHAAGAFAKGFVRAGPLAQFLTVAYLAKKVGVFSVIGQIAAQRFAGGYAKGGGGLGGGRGKSSGKGRGLVGSIPLAGTVALGIDEALGHPTIPQITDKLGITDASKRAETARRKRTNDFLVKHPNRQPIGGGVRGVSPRSRGGDIILHDTIKLDGKPIAKSVRRIARDQQARRG